MLTELSIRNLAVIQSLHLIFKSGFHVLTGETGAGKSIIIDALSLVVGGRGSSELVRYGSEKAEIEASFDIGETHPVWRVLQEQGIEASTQEGLIIRREITAAGKSASRINGQLVNLTMLREVGEWLVNIHGQHEHQSLLKVDQHIHWLDLYGDKQIASVKKTYRDKFVQWNAIRKELKEIQETSKQSLQMLDLYRFQVDEIDSAQLKIGEEEALDDERRKLSNAEKLMQHASDAYDALSGGNRGLDSVRKALQRMKDIAALDQEAIQPIVEQMEGAFFQLEDAVYGIRDYRDNIEFNPTRLHQIEQRLDAIFGLRRKYGERIADILAYAAQIEAELQAIENKDETIVALQGQLKSIEAELIEAAIQLSEQRQQAASRLAKEIETELLDLHMERTQFHVQLERLQDAANGVTVDGAQLRLSAEGIDHVEFLMSPNPGEPLRGLSKIASGGELSRIMLAMKSIFARIDQIPVLVFDEVDTGVSGRAAQAIAEKLSQLSRSCQVFSITHLPQVASMADAHYSIHKEVEGERTFTQVTDLSLEGRVEELARMIGGAQITATSKQHSEEMLALAAGKKSR
jgi:DNA repair protein RecN (Recombination protein N)